MAAHNPTARLEFFVMAFCYCGINSRYRDQAPPLPIYLILLLTPGYELNALSSYLPLFSFAVGFHGSNHNYLLLR
jgi:hypothetical protein